MTNPQTEIKDIEVDGNTVRFINVRKGAAKEPSIVIETRRIPLRKCKGCGMTLWNGISGDLCLECLSNRKKKLENKGEDKCNQY